MHRREQAAASDVVARFGIRTPGLNATLGQLSGGNQQKAILGRWLRNRPKALLLDEPTQGVDIGARAEIYKQIRNAVIDGAAVLVVSSDLEELLLLADRVVVLNRGRITAEARRPVLNREWLITHIFAPDLEAAFGGG